MFPYVMIRRKKEQMFLEDRGLSLKLLFAGTSWGASSRFLFMYIAGTSTWEYMFITYYSHYPPWLALRELFKSVISVY